MQGLYAITDEILTPDETMLAQCEDALRAGVKVLQFRDKSRSDAQVKKFCVALQELCSEHDALFVIDDRVELACGIGADGLHIGKDDMSVKEARERFGGILGVSCYGSVKKALEAQSEGADYVAFGSFFPSPTKPHSGVVNLSVLKKAKEALSIPICAIGGINAQNIHEIAAQGVDMIAVVSAVFDGDAYKNVNALLSRLCEEDSL